MFEKLNWVWTGLLAAILGIDIGLGKPFFWTVAVDILLLAVMAALSLDTWYRAEQERRYAAEYVRRAREALEEPKVSLEKVSVEPMPVEEYVGAPHALGTSLDCGICASIRRNREGE